MTQTRTFLILAWLMVAVLLWMEWGKQHKAGDAAVLPASAATMPSAVPTQAVPGATVAAPAPAAAAGGRDDALRDGRQPGTSGLRSPA